MIQLKTKNAHTVYQCQREFLSLLVLKKAFRDNWNECFEDWMPLVSPNQQSTETTSVNKIQQQNLANKLSTLLISLRYFPLPVFPLLVPFVAAVEALSLDVSAITFPSSSRPTSSNSVTYPPYHPYFVETTGNFYQLHTLNSVRF